MVSHDDTGHSDRLVTCYVDESSTDDKVLPHGVLGAVLFNRNGFVAFDPEWSDLLERYGIEPPLHMSEFGRHGKHGHFDRRQRACLIGEAVHLINTYKIISLSTWLHNRLWEQCMDSAIRRAYSVYAMCFMGMVVRNRNNADHNHFQGRIAYLFDDGNSKKHHIRKAHSVLRESEFDSRLRLGSLTFEHDTFVTGLQAADMVAWTERRRRGGHPFRNGFESLEALFSDEHHLETEMTPTILRELNEALTEKATDDADDIPPE